MPTRIWNGHDLDKGVPEFGMRPNFASLIPEFASQFLQTGLFADTQSLFVAPLDDLKGWLRENAATRGKLCELVRDTLLAEEEKARTIAAGKGLKFDLVDFELHQMEDDPTYEQFNPEWVKNLLELSIEESDSIQAWCKKENVANYCLSISFSLPNPRNNPAFNLEEIGKILASYGSSEETLRRALLGRGKPIEFTGALQMELLPRGAKPGYPQSKETAFVAVNLEEARAGDETDASLSLLYPRQLEGYFLMTFDAARKAMLLKDLK